MDTDYPPQGGQYSTPNNKLTKKGDSELRRLLYNVAMAARRDEVWEPFYARLRKRGLSSTAALMALGRKIARVCFALMNKDVEFIQHSVLGLTLNIES